MDWICTIQRALDYIEDNITEQLDFEEIAKAGYSSSFHFQRVFGILCGMTLGEYIRNRRLSLAGAELASDRLRVIDAALRYGYDSPDSFAKAFTRFHGITPSAAREPGAKLRSFARMSIKLTLEGGNTMDYRIIEKKSFTVIEKVEKQSTKDDENKKSIPEFWTRSGDDGTIATLCASAKGKYLFGICYDSAECGDTFDYSIGAECERNVKAPEGFRVSEIPERTWAVFECVGAMPKAIQNTWHRIYTEFFPASGYEPTGELEIEAYTDGDMSRDDYVSEIWIPVVKKK